jgi:ligand-binding sensor domain-containing protein
VGRFYLVLIFNIAIFFLSKGFCQITWTQYTFENTNGKLGSNMVYKVALDPSDNGRTIWIGNRPSGEWGWIGGLTKFDRETETWKQYTTDNSNLPNNRIWDIEFDSEGDMWIATHGSGLVKFDGQTNWTIYDEDNSELGYDYIYEIEIDEQGILWIGHGDPTGVGGQTALTIFDRVDKWHVFTSETTPLVDNTCYAITFGLDGLRWFGQKNSGIFSMDDNGTPFDPTDDQWTRYTESEGLERNTINAGTGETNINGDIWFGHDRGPGSDDYSPGCARYTNSVWINYFADTARIRAIEHDSQGNIWLGDKGEDAGSTGLWKFDGSTWQQWNTENTDIPFDWINCLTIDEINGIMWIGFHGEDIEEGGLCKVEGLIQPVSIHPAKKLPSGFYLSNNYPNPFNPETVIEYQLPSSQNIILNIYDLRGNLVQSLIDQKQSAGIHRVIWKGVNQRGCRVSSGVYIYKLETASGFQQTKKAILIR